MIYIFIQDTIRQVLHTVMTEGIKIDYGQKLGKTIIFTKNHDYAEKILEIFNKDYPHLNGFAQVIDNRCKMNVKNCVDFASILFKMSL